MSSHSENKDRIYGILFGILSAICVAIYVTTNKLIYKNHDINAIEYSLVFAMTGAVYAFGSLATQWNKETTRSVKTNIIPLTILGFFGALSVALLTIGQQYTTAVNTSLLVTITIVTTALFSHYMLYEKYKKNELLWMAVLFIGLYIGVVGFHSVSLNSGDIIILVSTLFFGFGNVFSRKVMKNMGSARLVPDIRLALGGLFALLIGLFLIRDWKVIVSLLPLAIIAGLFYWLCLKFFSYSIYLVNANNAIVLNNSQIFFTSLAGVVILSEAYSLNKFLGSVIAIISIYFIAAKK